MRLADKLFVLFRTHSRSFLVLSLGLSMLVIIPVVFGNSPKFVKAGSVSGPKCDRSHSECVPKIIKIETDYNEATVYFENCGDLCKEMVVSFGKDPLANTSEIQFSPTVSSEGNSLIYTVGALDPSTNYFFKIRCSDKKKCFVYSQTQKVHTSQCQTSFESNSDIATVLTCGAPKKEAQILGTISNNDSSNNTKPTIYSVLAVVSTLVGVGIYFFVKMKYSKHVFRKRTRGGFYHRPTVVSA